MSRLAASSFESVAVAAAETYAQIKKRSALCRRPSPPSAVMDPLRSCRFLQPTPCPTSTSSLNVPRGMLQLLQWALSCLACFRRQR